MRTHGKVDLNQAEIVKALRKVGATVQSLASVGRGCPDLLVGFHHRWTLLEVKGEKEKLTPMESDWHHRANGHVYVVRSIEEALICVGCITTEVGRKSA